MPAVSNIPKIAVFQCTAEERERLLSTLRETLATRENVAFAYVYGSFWDGLPFHDLDVGVFLAGAGEREDVWVDVEIGRDLELAVWRARIICQPSSTADGGRPRIPVDVRALNKAPAAFSYHVLRGGLLFSRNEEVRVPWVVRTISCYLDLKPLRHAALKEAMDSIAFSGNV